ncbi:hypothetical protein [Eubacterium limosum]|uniref:hypothetical protein n=1 Tax=Eubacterium limosum TaxID=1736 RepID=UPI0022E15788|nr:hypothetical protein [Eubacterium limosum]
MNVKISRFVNLKILAVTLAVIIAIMPFFQPKKVQASPLLIGIVALLTTGMIAGGYARDTILTPEQINNANDYCTANLQTAFPDPAEYNKQLTALQNLDNDIRAGKDIEWSKYSGKALYAVLKGVVDVVWPEQLEPEISGITKVLGYFSDGYVLWAPYAKWNESINPRWPFPVSVPATDGSFVRGFCVGYKSEHNPGSYGKVGISFTVHFNSTGEDIGGYFVSSNSAYPDEYGDQVSCVVSDRVANAFLGNASFVSSVKRVTANKVKLPTRLPQTVINNINKYYNGDTENLTIAPTPEELPTLPDGYNPNTDELPDLPGYVDVTPDQQPTDTPDPTPTPVEPTPTPEGDYNGDRWVNPIGDFFDGLLKFMKAAFVPTLSLNLDALSAVPDNLGEKFPFSLPSDIIGMVTMFQAEPVPIEISFNIPTHIFGYQDIPIKGDTSFMDDYMPAIRNLIFLIFLFSLAWSTFNMFFGGGDD